MRLDWLGTPALSWRDLWVIVHQSPRSTAALQRSILGEAAEWGPAEYLLAGILEHQQVLVWFGSADGAKNRNRPTPLPRPELPASEAPAATGHASSIEQMEAELKKRNPAQHSEPDEGVAHV